MTSALSVRSRAAVLLTVAVVGVGLALASRSTRSADLRPDYRPPAYAIKGARVEAEPGTVFDPGTVVIRNGLIEAVGPADRVEIPFDAETVEGKGLTVYPGFIDLFTTLGQPAQVTRSLTGPGRPVNLADHAMASTPPDNRHGLTPEFEVANVFELPEATARGRRELGFCDLLAAPPGAIATGQSALVSLGGLARRESIVQTPVALHLNVRVPGDAPPAPADEDAPAPRRRRGATEIQYPASLMGVVAHLRQAMLDAEYTAHPLIAHPRPFDPALKALGRARSKALPAWWEANTRDEIHRALDLADEFGTTCVIVGGREAGKVADRLKAGDVPVVLRLDFPDEPKVPAESEYRKREPIDREEPYKVLLDRAARWREWVETAATLDRAGVRFGVSTEGLTKSQNVHSQVRKLIAAGLPKGSAVDALTRRAAAIAGLSDRLGTISAGRLGHVVAWTGEYGAEKSRPRYVFVDGQKFDLEKPTASKKKAQRDATTTTTTTAKEARDEPARKAEDAPTPEDRPSAKPFADVATEFEESRRPSVRTGGNVFIKNATVLTVTREPGTIARGSILVKGGKIAAVGPDLEAPEGVTVIDATGLVVMPGIIDTHSHIAIQGNVNELSLSIVPEVRVRDVVTGDHPAIYRALAGGTTAARLLHGSANTIGGQDAVIKLRAGRPGRELIVDDAPRGVKFALGENVTRVTGRFPNTRMGVESVIERAFREAKAYRALRADYEVRTSEGVALPVPRRDLRLEALADVLDGSLKVHCHCYRSDEILMLLGVAGRHGVRVRSLQHVLEGYKVAAEVASHGASASTFSDWWAYKIEALDAIPYNAALLTEAGVSVCIKSDSDELIRHLNLEAAKMVKYGGVSEHDALAMITLNPARELGLDARLGTIEVGKDADLAVFNGHPFNAYSRCELALIDGEVWFQRQRPGGPDAKAVTHPPTLARPDPGLDRRPLALPDGDSFALVGATVHPVSGPEIANGTVVIGAREIKAVGGPDTAIPDGVKTVDVRGYDLWPGLVDAGSVVGLNEIGSLRETQDSADSARYQPELHTSAALHPDSILIPVTRANGVLTSYAEPTGGTISGQGCLIGLDGWVPREMVVVDRLALHVQIPAYVRPPSPDEPRRTTATGSEAPDPRARRRERLDGIKEQFDRAREYQRVVKESRARKLPPPPPDPRLEALAPYTAGEKPVIFHADHRNEILDALKLARDLKLKAVVSGGRDAWKVADALKEAGVPVIVAGTLRLPAEPTDPYDAAYANPARLFEAGVTFAICSRRGGPDLATCPRNLPYEAATAAAFGLPRDEAVRAVTLSPAKILGVSDRVGSIEVGKRADLVVTAGPILQPTTVVKLLVLNGKPLAPESRQTELYQRYRGRLHEVRAGRSSLGLEGPESKPAESQSHR